MGCYFSLFFSPMLFQIKNKLKKNSTFHFEYKFAFVHILPTSIKTVLVYLKIVKQKWKEKIHIPQKTRTQKC